MVLLLSRWVKWEVARIWLFQSLQPTEVNCRITSSNLLFPLADISPPAVSINSSKARTYSYGQLLIKFIIVGALGNVFTMMCLYDAGIILGLWLPEKMWDQLACIYVAIWVMRSGRVLVLVLLFGFACLFGLLWWRRTAVLEMSHHLQ